jgi:uncharacterized membrane protein YphA (DoxX/SURF4 family)
MAIVIFIVSWAARLLLAAFFAFVGYWKALGPIEALAEHHAWVAHFPDWFARGVGWSEIACALALLIPAFPQTRCVALWGAVVLVINQVAALGVHISRGEAQGAAPQNFVIIAMLALVIAMTARRRQ